MNNDHQCVLTSGYYDSDITQCNLDTFIINNKRQYAIQHGYSLLEIPYEWLIYEEVHNHRTKL